MCGGKGAAAAGQARWRVNDGPSHMEALLDHPDGPASPRQHRERERRPSRILGRTPACSARGRPGDSPRDPWWFHATSHPRPGGL